MNNKVNFNFIEPELTEPDVNTLQPASYIRKEFVVSGVVCSKRLLNQVVGKSLRTHNLKS